MGKDDLWIQCRLKKEIEGGHSEQVAWIPARGATINAVIELKLQDGTVDGGWIVKEVGESPISKEAVLSFEEYHRKYQKDKGV